MIDNAVLLEKIHSGGTDAENQLILNNMGLVGGIAKRFTNRGYDYDELFQVGSIGLIKAVKRFNVEFNVCFSTYAVPMIIGEIKRFIRDDGIIKVSRVHKTNALKIKLCQEKLMQKYNRAPTIGELSKETGISDAEIIEALDATAAPESINQKYESDDDREFVDKIGRESVESEILDKVLIKESLNILNNREKKIIVMRYFMGKTQSKIAESIGVSQVQISRIEKQALLKMRDFLNDE